MEERGVIGRRGVVADVGEVRGVEAGVVVGRGGGVGGGVLGEGGLRWWKVVVVHEEGFHVLHEGKVFWNPICCA